MSETPKTRRSPVPREEKTSSRWAEKAEASIDWGMKMTEGRPPKRVMPAMPSRSTAREHCVMGAGQTDSATSKPHSR